MAAIKTLTIAEIAESTGLNARTIRKAIRANESMTNAGRGGRYAIRESDVSKVVEMVNAFNAKTATVLEFPDED